MVLRFVLKLCGVVSVAREYDGLVAIHPAEDVRMACTSTLRSGQRELVHDNHGGAFFITQFSLSPSVGILSDWAALEIALRTVFIKYRYTITCIKL